MAARPNRQHQEWQSILEKELYKYNEDLGGLVKKSTASSSFDYIAVVKNIFRGSSNTGGTLNRGEALEVLLDVMGGADHKDIIQKLKNSKSTRDNVSFLQQGDIEKLGTQIQVKGAGATIMSKTLRPYLAAESAFGQNYASLSAFLANPTLPSSGAEAFIKASMNDYLKFNAAQLYMIGIDTPSGLSKIGPSEEKYNLNLRDLIKMSLAIEMRPNQMQQLAEGKYGASPFKIKDDKPKVKGLNKDFFLGVLDGRIEYAKKKGESRSVQILEELKKEYLQGKKGKGSIQDFFSVELEKLNKTSIETQNLLYTLINLGIRYQPPSGMGGSMILQSLPERRGGVGEFILHAPTTKLLALYILTLLGDTKHTRIGIDNYFYQFMSNQRHFTNYFGQPLANKQ